MASRAVRRVPSIRFPNRHSRPEAPSPAAASGDAGASATPAVSSAAPQEGGKKDKAPAAATGVPRSPSSPSTGGLASEQPTRGGLSEREIDAIMMGSAI